MRRTTFLLLVLNLVYSLCHGQQCSGAEVYSNSDFLYGRFEVSMQSAQGNGIISSFFLFNKETGCEWPANNNEIDFEMTGNNNLVYMTTHHPDENQPWFYGDTIDFLDNPHDDLNTYVIEWEPGVVRWFINESLVYVQNEEATQDLMYPMAIFMNIWPADFVDWVGVWDETILPTSAIYDYVKYYRYTPDQGNAGTNNNFILEWEDDFNDLDTSRWKVSEFKQLSNSYCDFSLSSVEILEGKLHLGLKEKEVVENLVPVTFSVNMEGANLNESDKVYVNGTFNEWCGSCNEMKKDGDIWSLELELVPGIYEYLFTVNGWDVIGGAPAGSACDYNPCDEFYNYGFVLSEEAQTKVLSTYCWNECSTCAISSTSEFSMNDHKELIGIYNINGQSVNEMENQLLFYVYSDGSVVKKVILQH